VLLPLPIHFTTRSPDGGIIVARRWKGTDVEFHGSTRIYYRLRSLGYGRGRVGGMAHRNPRLFAVLNIARPHGPLMLTRKQASMFAALVNNFAPKQRMETQ
jgi:hypothetical protein